MLQKSIFAEFVFDLHLSLLTEQTQCNDIIPNFKDFSILTLRTGVFGSNFKEGNVKIFIQKMIKTRISEKD